MNVRFKLKLNTFFNRFSIHAFLQRERIRGNRKTPELSIEENPFETIVSLKKRIHVLEIAQSQTENYLNHIIRIIPANVYWKDLNCVLLGGNLSHAKQAGFSDPKDVIGKTEHDFAWKESAEKIMENDRLIMASGIGRQFEEKGLLSDGKMHTFLTCKAPVRDEKDTVIGLIGVSTDITEFKAIQDELLREKTLAAKSAAHISKMKAIAEEEMRKSIMIFAGNIVHDIRTPMTSIKMVADILDAYLPKILEIVEEAETLGAVKTKGLHQSSWDYLKNKTPITEIQNAIAMMNDFINTTLRELTNAHDSVSCELAGDELTTHSIQTIIDNTLQAYPLSDDEKNKIKLNVICDFHVMGNSILVMKLLINLIKNAFEQIALHGRGDIIISTDKGDDYHLVSIKDTAGGAPPDIVSHLFNGYFTTKENGTGIGLAFCKKTMLGFGGDIMCNSVYGESMEFVLKFPV